MCMTCGKSGKTGGNQPYTPKPKTMIHRNLGVSGSGSSQGFGRPKVTAKFSGRSK